MTERPKPPKGYETWLDACLSGNCVVPAKWQCYARAELEELREFKASVVRFILAADVEVARKWACAQGLIPEPSERP